MVRMVTEELARRLPWALLCWVWEHWKGGLQYMISKFAHRNRRCYYAGIIH
jgi:hypothetical protein